MGSIRLLLAAAVLAGHIGGPFRYVLGADVAVELFFAISGYLIAYILADRASYRRLSAFYLNRFLRIYPVYAVVAAATLPLWAIKGRWLHDFLDLNAAAKTFLVAVNAGILGQDWVWFLRQSGDALGFTADFNRTDPQLWTFLLIPPAWSLGLELGFYLLAPFVVRSLGATVALAAGSLAAKLIAARHGLGGDPWTYRFFPFELWVFLAGALSQRLLAPRLAARFERGGLGRVSLGATLAAFALVPLVPAPDAARSFALILCLAVALPGLFAFQAGRSWDVRLGDLSYPIYLCHWPVIVVLNAAALKLSVSTRWAIDGAAVLATLLIAVALERGIARPVERLRRRVRGAPAPIDAPGAATVGAARTR